MNGTYKRLDQINPELFRSIIAGDREVEPAQEQTGLMAPATSQDNTPSTIPQQNMNGLAPRFSDTPVELEQSILGIVAQNLGRSAIDRQRVADAVVPRKQTQEADLSDWESMPPLEQTLRGDTTRAALGSVPDPVNIEGSTRGPEPVSQQQEDQPDSEPVTDEGFRPPEFYAENLNDTQKEIYENALKGAREAGLSGVELAQYMAQLGHESDNFRTAEEYASGAAYEGREDLGNTQPGDGRRYKGRGYIQLTGRANYQAAGDALGIDLVNNPDLVSSDPAIASAVSLWYWQNRVQPQVEDFSDTRTVTRIINGGYNGLEDRMTKFEQFTGGGDRGFTDLAPSDSLVPRPRPNRQE